MEQKNLLDSFTKTARDYVERFWQDDLSVQLMPDPKQEIFITGSASGFAAARGVMHLCASCPEDAGCIIIVDPDGDDPEAEASIKNARANGQSIILITGERADQAASLAEHCIALKTSGAFFGAAGYLAAQIVVLAVCCSRLVFLNKMSVDRFQSIGKEICSYAEALQKNAPDLLTEADAFAKRICQNWQLDLIADGSVEAVSEYLRALYCKEGGFLCSVNDSEEWCHVDFWCLKRTDIASICACSEGSPAFSRFAETMSTVHRLERPYLIITDAAKDAFYPDTHICRMPPLAKENWFLAALFFHIPAVMALDTINKLRLEQEVTHE